MDVASSLIKLIAIGQFAGSRANMIDPTGKRAGNGPPSPKHAKKAPGKPEPLF